MFYCPGGGSLWPLMAVCGVVWMLLLFYGMSVVAEVFLCPAVEVRACSIVVEPFCRATPASMFLCFFMSSMSMRWPSELARRACRADACQ